jgi:hypothetical protein
VVFLKEKRTNMALIISSLGKGRIPRLRNIAVDCHAEALGSISDTTRKIKKV